MPDFIVYVYTYLLFDRHVLFAWQHVSVLLGFCIGLTRNLVLQFLSLYNNVGVAKSEHLN